MFCWEKKKPKKTKDKPDRSEDLRGEEVHSKNEAADVLKSFSLHRSVAPVMSYTEDLLNSIPTSGEKHTEDGLSPPPPPGDAVGVPLPPRHPSDCIAPVPPPIMPERHYTCIAPRPVHIPTDADERPHLDCIAPHTPPDMPTMPHPPLPTTSLPVQDEKLEELLEKPSQPEILEDELLAKPTGEELPSFVFDNYESVRISSQTIHFNLFHPLRAF